MVPDAVSGSHNIKREDKNMLSAIQKLAAREKTSTYPAEKQKIGDSWLYKLKQAYLSNPLTAKLAQQLRDD